MKKNNDSEADILDKPSLVQLLKTTGNDVFSKAGNHLKRLFFITSLAGLVIFMNSCLAGYIGSEPTYVEFSRPAPPSSLHIWINGDWSYNRQSHVYVQKAGYWQKPYQGKTYVSGHWQTTPRGKSWAPGYWQKQNGHGNNHKR